MHVCISFVSWIKSYDAYALEFISHHHHHLIIIIIIISSSSSPPSSSSSSPSSSSSSRSSSSPSASSFHHFFNINQSVSQPISQSIYQSVSHSVSQSIIAAPNLITSIITTITPVIISNHQGHNGGHQRPHLAPRKSYHTEPSNPPEKLEVRHDDFSGLAIGAILTDKPWKTCSLHAVHSDKRWQHMRPHIPKGAPVCSFWLFGCSNQTGGNIYAWTLYGKMFRRMCSCLLGQRASCGLHIDQSCWREASTDVHASSLSYFTNPKLTKTNISASKAIVHLVVVGDEVTHKSPEAWSPALIYSTPRKKLVWK